MRRFPRNRRFLTSEMTTRTGLDPGCEASTLPPSCWMASAAVSLVWYTANANLRAAEERYVRCAERGGGGYKCQIVRIDFRPNGIPAIQAGFSGILFHRNFRRNFAPPHPQAQNSGPEVGLNRP